MNENYEVLKAGCVVVDHGKVLLICNEEHTAYQFPKGHMESGETPEETAVRETLEETGYHVKIDNQLSDVTYVNKETGHQVRVKLFLASLVGEPHGFADELWEWVEIERARKVLYPNLVPVLDELA